MKVYERIAGARGATLSECGLFRYSIWRCWDESLDPHVGILCNPSTANAYEDDPSLRKGMGFARRLGYGGVCWVNLYDVKATDPKVLRGLGVGDAIGDDHSAAIDAALALAGPRGMLVGWGGAARDNGPHYEDQVAWFVSKAAAVGAPLFALKVATDGRTPYHPLMLPYSLTPQPWRWFGDACRDCAA